jgi:hypothetical protein
MEAMASRLDVHFVARDAGGTEMILVHRDFPRHGDGWEKYRKDMAAPKGWPRLVELYVQAVGKGG